MARQGPYASPSRRTPPIDRTGSEKPIPGRCGAKLRNSRTGAKFCPSYPLRGGATRCRMHGGKQQRLPEGDPGRGGRPAVTRLYARHLLPEQQEAFEAAAGVEGLKDELRLARANLDWAVQKHAANPNGGAMVTVATRGQARTVRFRPWFEIILEHLDRIRRLHEAIVSTEGNARAASLEDLILEAGKDR